MKPGTTCSVTLIAFLLLQLMMCSNTGEAKNEPETKLSDIPGDTSLRNFQQAVDSATRFILEYNMLKYTLGKNQNSLDSNTRAQKEITAKLAETENYNLAAICTTDTSKKMQNKARQELKKIHHQIFQLQQTNEKLKLDYELLQQEKTRNAQLLTTKETELKNQNKKLALFTNQATGTFSLSFIGKKYQVFIAGIKTHQVFIHNNPNGSYTFKKFGEYIQKELKSDPPLMITNGGMFNNNYSPQGLLVSSGKITAGLDSATAKNEGNFYLYPNGVFVVEGNEGFQVLETKEYIRTYLNGKKIPAFATQSGPMLVHNGQVHGSFTPGSANINIRSGAGIATKDKVIFIISRQPVNFYEMALLYRYVFNCSDALYLDGAISKMYVTGDKEMPAGEFGPMIAVLKKK